MLPRAITSPEHTRIQLDGQWAELLACIPTPATIYTARVNGTPGSTDQLTQLTYDGGSGTLANVKPGMTIWVGSSAGATDKGQARIRKTPTSTIFYIGTESEIAVVDNDFLTVVDEFGLWEKQVRIAAGVVYMDYDVTYSGQNAAPLPVVVMGGPAVLELRGASVTASFDASNSWVPGGGSKTYLWVAPGSSATTGLTSATPTMSYTAAGRYRVSCTVTIGGVANTRYEYIQVFDVSNLPITQFQARSITGSKQSGGYAWEMTMYAQADLTTVRDRAQVILFTRDHYGSQGQVETGYATGRENIFAIGWIAGETIQWSPDLSSVTFQVEGAQAWLGRVNAYPQGLEDITSAPAVWTDYEALTMTAFLWHLLTWRSTVAQAIDCIVETSTTRVIELSAAATSLWEQISVTAGQRLLAPPCCDHLSRLFVLIDSQVRADRSGVVEVMTLAKADWRAPIQINRNALSQTSMVDLNGFAWDGANATALFSLSPGRVWKRYGRVQSVQAMLLDDQTQANTLAGLICGQANNDYPSITIQLAGNNRMLDIAPDCYALLTLAATDTPRGISFTAKRLIPRRISWNFDPASGGLLPTVEFEGESFAELAVTGDAPATDPIPPPPPTCPGGYHWDGTQCVKDTTPPPGQGDGKTMFGAPGPTPQIVRTFNFGAGAATHWEDITGSITFGSGSFLDILRLDPWDPAHKAVVLTFDGVWMCANTTDPTPTWTNVLTPGDIVAGTAAGVEITSRSNLRTSIHGNGRLYLLVGGPLSTNPGVWVGHTDAYSGGAGTWAWTHVGTATVSPDYAADLHVGQDGDDLVLVTFRHNSYLSLYYSTDHAASFSEKNFSGENFTAKDALVFTPYGYNNQRILIFNGSTSVNTIDNRIVVSVAGPTGSWGSFLGTLPAGFDNNDLSTFLTTEAVTESPSSNGQYLYYCASNISPLSPANNLTKSGIVRFAYLDPEGSTDEWFEVIHVAAANGQNFSSIGFGGWPWDNNRLQMSNAGLGSGHVGQSLDGGATWIDQTGDLATAAPGVTAIGYLVPVWLAY